MQGISGIIWRMEESAGRCALVSGASSGIGRAIALTLAEPSATVHLVGRDRGRLEACATEVRGRGASAVVEVADLADDRAVESLAARLTRLDLLVHAAGVVRLGPVASAPIADLDLQFALNVRAPYLLTQRCLSLLRAHQGQVVFVNSGAGTTARAGWGQYAATKFALRALADSLREEEKSHGVRVLSVFPGRTATPMQAEVHRLEGKVYDPDRFIRPEDVATLVRQAIDLPPTARVTEIHVRHPE